MRESTRSNLRGAADRYGVTVLTAGALVWLSLSGGGYGPYPRHVAGALVWLCALGLLVWGGQSVLPRGAVRRIAVAIAAFAALSGLSMAWSESAGRSYNELTRVLLYLGVFVVVAAIASYGPRRRDQLLEGITLGVVIVAALAVLSRLVPGPFPDQELLRLAPSFQARLAYPFNYWNAVGSFVAIAIVLLVHAATRLDRSRVYRALATAALPGAGLALYLTFSRGALIAVGVGVALLVAFSPRRLAAFGSAALGLIGAVPLVLLTRHFAELNDGLLNEPEAWSQGRWVLFAVVVVSSTVFATRGILEHHTWPRRAADALAPHRKKFAIAGAVVIVLGAAAAAPKIADRIDAFRAPVVEQGTQTNTGIETRLASGSGNGRAQQWDASWEAWKADPIAGHGAGTWEFWWARNGSLPIPSRDSHSLFFDVIAELGLLGVAALFAMIGLAVWACVSAARRARGSERAALVAIGSAAAAWAVGAATDWLWEVPAVTVVFFGLVALAASAVPGEATAPAASRSRSRTLAVVAVGVVAWLVVMAQATAAVSAKKIEQSVHAVGQSRFRDAYDDAKVARTLQPWAADGYMQMALVRLQTHPDQETVRLARQAVDREDTNWRTWLVLVRIEARTGQLGKATTDVGKVRELGAPASLVPSAQTLQDISTFKIDP